MKLHYHILDVFTDTAFTGNGLVVVLGADGLTDKLYRFVLSRKPQNASTRHPDESLRSSLGDK